jgi:RNA polymerase sigma factor (sigma-70 family)
VYVPDWTPCISDPDDFDCSDCELAAEACRLRVDDGLRHYVVAQRRRWRGVAVSVDKEGDLNLRAAIEVLRAQRLAMPAGLLARIVGASGGQASSDLVSALRSSSAIHETSPGMFALSAGSGLSDVSHMRADLHSGAQLEAAIYASPMPGRSEQRRLLKRYRGLVVARDSLSRGGSDLLVAVIEGLRGQVATARGWTSRDIALYATNDELVPAMPEGTNVDATSQLLASVYALQLVHNGHVFGDVDAVRQTLVLTNLRLVAKLALRYAGRGSMLFMDLFEYGVFGLLRAIERFDPYRGFEFSTYATWWVRQRITRAIADEGSLIRVPVHAYETVAKSRSRDQDSVALSSTDSSVATAAKAALRPTLTLEAIATIRDPSTEVEIELLELRAVLLPLLEALTPFERRVISARTGLDGAPETLQAVGERLGVSRERIRQVESKALKRLRRVARNHQIRAEDLGIVGDHFLEGGDLQDVPGDPTEGDVVRAGSVKHPGRRQPELTDARRQKGGSPRPTQQELDLVRANTRRTSRARRLQQRAEGRRGSTPASYTVPDQGAAIQPGVSALPSVQSQVSSALRASDVRIARLGGWRAEMGFVSAPSKLGPEARAAVEAARRRILGSSHGT